MTTFKYQVNNTVRDSESRSEKSALKNQIDPGDL